MSLTARKQFEKLVKDHREKASRLTRQLDPNRKKLSRVTIERWADKITALLVDGHSRAWQLGRLHAGDKSPLSDDDRLIGRGIVDNEQQWFEKFISDLEDGRYDLPDGTVNYKAIEARLNLYIGKYRATSAESWVEAGDELEEYEWVLGPEEHCTDCPRIASRSPYAKDELFAYPGSGDTECLSNCNCVLKRLSDGVESFARS